MSAIKKITAAILIVTMSGYYVSKHIDKYSMNCSNGIEIAQSI